VFALSVGEHAGKKAVDLGFMIASGGLSKVSSVTDALSAILETGKGVANDSGRICSEG